MLKETIAITVLRTIYETCISVKTNLVLFMKNETRCWSGLKEDQEQSLLDRRLLAGDRHLVTVTSPPRGAGTSFQFPTQFLVPFLTFFMISYT